MKFIIARPNIKAQNTAEAFKQAGLQAQALPVLDITLHTEQKLISQFQQSKANIVIVTSSYAAEWLIKHVKLNADNIHNTCFVCVGKKTAEMLCTIVSQATIQIASPENSEGVIKTPCLTLALSNPKPINIVLLKGHGGRELIEASLKRQHIALSILNVYKRHKNLGALRAFVFEPSEITCIIATSCEIIEMLCAGLDQRCLETFHWIVASERIKDYAYRKGLRQLSVSKGASNKALIECIELMS